MSSLIIISGYDVTRHHDHDFYKLGLYQRWWYLYTAICELFRLCSRTREQGNGSLVR